MVWLVWVFAAATGLASGPSDGCTAVDGPRILGRDLKRAASGFESIADEDLIGFTPSPGVERWLSAVEARRLGPAAEGLCFRRATRVLDSSMFEQALRSALAGHALDIDMVDFSRGGVPEGSLVFSLSNLVRPPRSDPQAAVMWRGQLRYDGNRSLPVWVKAHISESRRWVAATVALPRGEVVSAGQVEVRSGGRFPLGEELAEDPARFVGRLPKRTIAAGQPLDPAVFEDPPLVVRGESVSVEVLSGGVSLRFDARAESGGKLKDTVVVFESGSGRRSKARVVGKGRVVIDANVHTGVAVRDGDRGGAERIR